MAFSIEEIRITRPKVVFCDVCGKRSKIVVSMSANVEARGSHEAELMKLESMVSKELTKPYRHENCKKPKKVVDFSKKPWYDIDPKPKQAGKNI